MLHDHDRNLKYESAISKVRHGPHFSVRFFVPFRPHVVERITTTHTSPC